MASELFVFDVEILLLEFLVERGFLIDDRVESRLLDGREGATTQAGRVYTRIAGCRCLSGPWFRVAKRMTRSPSPNQATPVGKVKYTPRLPHPPLVPLQKNGQCRHSPRPALELQGLAGEGGPLEAGGTLGQVIHPLRMSNRLLLPHAGLKSLSNARLAT